MFRRFAIPVSIFVWAAVGLPKLRADVILTGVLIYETVMAEFNFSELRISTRGLRFAAVMD